MFIRDFNKHSEKSNKTIKSRQLSRDCRKKFNISRFKQAFAEFIEAMKIITM